MDRKSIIILVISGILLVLWMPLSHKIFPDIPAPKTNTAARANTSSNPAAIKSDQPGKALSPAITKAPSREEQTLTFDTPDATYTFTSIGGGFKQIALKHFPAAVDCLARRRPTNQVVTLNTKAPVPALAETEAGDTNSLIAFNLTRAGDVIRAEAPLTNGLQIIKEFRLSTNYLVKATIRYENHGAQAVAVPERELVIGTATPMGRRNESTYLGLEWFNGDSSTKITEQWFANRALGCGPGNPRTYYRAGLSNVAWAAVQNQFFTMIAVPSTPAGEVVAHRILLPPPTREEMSTDPSAFATPFGYQTALVLPAGTLAPAQSVEYHYDLFAGPKEYKTLQKLPGDIDRVMNFNGFFGFFAKALLLSMNGLAAIGIPYGLAIIVITVIIKLVFWPLTQASTRSMKRMAALQPQMKAIQEKYKDDPRKMNQKTMEFMKEHKVSPLGGCLPLLLQIPIFFGLYRMLQSAIELRGAHFLWACDLSQPDTIAYLAGFPINPFPLIMGATMLWQARLTPPSPGMDPGQQQIMRYMPLMMMVFLYNYQAGLTLYWSVQNLLSIAQMKITRNAPEQPQGGAPGSKPGRPIKPVSPPPKKK